VKILVATDFSPPAEAAVQAAAALAQRLGAEVALFHAVEPPFAPYPDLAAVSLQTLESSIRSSVEAQLQKVAARLCEAKLTVSTTILTGVPERVIPMQAREVGASLIVIGTHGRRALPRLLLGSVAERTVLEAPCPVLVVREDEAPLAALEQPGRTLRVMVGVDGGAATEAGLAWVRELRQHVPCDVVLVHHYWPPREYARLGLPGPRDVFATDPEVSALLERELRQRVGTLPGNGSVVLRVRAAWGPPGEALAEDAAEERADLLVMGTHQPHGWERVRHGSYALSAVRSTRVPVVCVPAALAGTEARAARPLPAMRSVLAATDLSDLGNQVVPYACALLRGGGTLELLHVRERKLPYPVYAYEATGDALTAEERRQIEERLRALVPAEAARLGIDVHVTVVDGGAAAEAIVQAGCRLGTDAVCVASHGRTGLRRALLGSVAQAVLVQADRPVLVVRTPAER
jgi:nucleotide-binding universal stress UspA family protein